MTTGADRFTVEVADGRSVEVSASGPSDGRTLVFHTGTPAGLVEYPPIIEAAAASGLRTVFYSRPGYGKSDPQPGRRVADAAADVAAVLDHLGAARFVTAGWSGGGPHALATAALLADRCAAVATIAGVAPYPAPGLDWLAGMAEENVTEFGAALRGEQALTASVEAAAAELGEVTAEQVAQAFGDLVTAADRAALTGEFAEYMAQSTRAAVSTGIAGWRDDDLAFVRDWGFSLGQVTAPVAIWQGDQDAMVPFAHGDWLARQLPQARAHLLPGEGHLTLVHARIGDILRELAELASEA
jgi:pimeloyl-ACP methyl ester carboxylesterase